jgi:hypothetical protein
MMMSHKFRSTTLPSPGDVLIDRSGNEMIVLEVVDEHSGDCYALYNGEVKLINALKSSIIIIPEKKNEDKEKNTTHETPGS